MTWKLDEYIRSWGVELEKLKEKKSHKQYINVLPQGTMLFYPAHLFSSFQPLAVICGSLNLIL